MLTPPTPHLEQQRLAVLRGYEILDTAPERDFDDLVELAAHLCNTPIALVSLIDVERQWFKAKHGLDATQTPRCNAFCAHAILCPHDVMVVEDARADLRFVDNPLTVGPPHVVFYAGAPLVTASGIALGTLCVIDHEPRRLDAHQIDALRVLARQVVVQLDLRLQIRQLEAAGLQAEEAARHKAGFLAMMSHEIRTPLNGIIGLIDVLKDTRLDASQREFAELLKSSSESLLSIINDTLDFAKIDAGKVEIERLAFSLSECLREVLDLVAAQARKHGVTLTMQVDPALPTQVRADVGHLRQVLLNLVTNAIKFTKQGTVAIEVSRASVPRGDQPAGQCWITISVTDSGTGIAPEAQTKLFRPFVQTSEAMPRRLGTSGLGLTICKRLVELMGGQIGMTSIVDVGSRFYFTIPVEASGAVGSTVSGRDAFNPVRFAGRVLVAEDNSINQRVIVAQLRKLGLIADIVANGLEALAAISNTPFDLVLMDCQMPELDGYQAAATVRRLEAEGKRTRLPIIAMTASVSAGDRDACLQAGMDDYMPKPVQMTMLIDVLGRFLATSTAAVEAGAEAR